MDLSVIHQMRQLDVLGYKRELVELVNRPSTRTVALPGGLAECPSWCDTTEHGTTWLTASGTESPTGGTSWIVQHRMTLASHDDGHAVVTLVWGCEHDPTSGTPQGRCQLPTLEVGAAVLDDSLALDLSTVLAFASDLARVVRIRHVQP